MNQMHSRSGSRGFTLMEALIALLVMAFGMLAIASFQTTLSRTSDVAKQRAEATRLAQQAIEGLRSFQQTATSTSAVVWSNTASSGTWTYADTIVGSSDTVTTNTTYTRTITCLANGAACTAGVTTGVYQKWITVNVAWTDRTGASQSVTLNSVIADSDPVDIGTMGVGTGGSNIKKPKNRSINIPYPAVTLSGGTSSAFKPPGASAFFVFNNSTGNVTQRCTGGTAPTTEGQTLASTGATCNDIDAYLLSGYVSFATANSISASDLENPTTTTLPLDSTTPLSFDFSNQTSSNGNPTYECFSERQKTLRDNSAQTETTVAETSTASGSVVARFIAYTCVVTPVDHDNSSTTAKRWWGKVTLNPNSSSSVGTVWTIGTTNSTYKVCRYTGDYNANSKISNSEHPLWYRGVTGALDSQNYAVILGSNDCPTDVASDPVNGDFVNTNTAGHQPSSIAAFSFKCTNASCSGANKVTLESSTTSTDLDME